MSTEPSSWFEINEGDRNPARQAVGVRSLSPEPVERFYRHDIAFLMPTLNTDGENWAERTWADSSVGPSGKKSKRTRAVALSVRAAATPGYELASRNDPDSVNMGW